MRRDSLEVRLFLDHGGQNIRCGLTLEGRFARKHLEQHAAECPDVGPLIDCLAAGLLGRHISGGAEDDSRASGRNRYCRRVDTLAGRGSLPHRLCQAEVQHFHHTRWRDFDVRRFQIAMHFAFLMRCFERFGDLTCPRRR